MKTFVLALVFALVPVLGFAQTPPDKKVPYPVPASVFVGFDHDGINTEDYGIRIDGQTRVVVPAVRVGPDRDGVPGLFEYEFPFPAMTPGLHTFTVDAFNMAGCGVSAPFVVELVVVPANPSSIRLVIR